MKNIAIASLLGATYGAAVLGPLPKDNTNWPQFASKETLAESTTSKGDVGTANFQQNSVTIGALRGWRNDKIVYLTQLLKVHAGNEVAGVVQAQTTTRTFWGFKSADIGAYFVTSAGASTDPSSAGWVACTTSATSAACTGSMSVKRGSPDVNYPYTYRVYMQASKLGTAQDVGGDSTYKAKVTTFNWNTDILDHTFYHSAQQATAIKTDGSEWCSTFSVALDSANVEFTAQMGFTGKTKCTWQISTKDGSKAPGFYMNSADFINFMISYFEFMSSTGIGNGGLLPGTDAADFHLGAYTSTDSLVFLNPLTTITAPPSGTQTGWTVYSNVQAYKTNDPNSVAAGSWGTAIYYPGNAGIFVDTLYATDSAYIQQQVQYKKDENNSYNSEKSSYDTKKTTYNKAVDDEDTRQKDFFKATFEPKIAIPTRPDPPTQPYGYVGPSLKCSTGSTTALKATSALQGLVGTMKVGTTTQVTNSAAVADGTRSGFLVSTADTTGTSGWNVDAAAKAFGKLGQGDATNPNKGATGWYYGAASTSNKPVMMISFFPTVATDAGLLTTKSVKMTAKPLSWQGLDDYAVPGQPAAAEAPKSTGASYLKVGIAASALIAATLI